MKSRDSDAKLRAHSEVKTWLRLRLLPLPPPTVFVPTVCRLLSDFHPKGELSRRYKVYREENGFSERALFVIDREGIIAWSHVSPIEVNPGADGVLEVLERLSGKRLDESINAPQRQPAARP